MLYGILKENNQIWGNTDRDVILSSLVVRPEYTEDDIQEFTDNEIELAYNGFYYLKGYAPKPTTQWIQEQRERAYTLEVDPITCHINRLKDEEQTPEIIAEIEALMQERAEKVQEIKECYPYPDEEK